MVLYIQKVDLNNEVFVVDCVLRCNVHIHYILTTKERIFLVENGVELEINAYIQWKKGSMKCF